MTRPCKSCAAEGRACEDRRELLRDLDAFAVWAGSNPIVERPNLFSCAVIAKALEALVENIEQEF